MDGKAKTLDAARAQREVTRPSFVKQENVVMPDGARAAVEFTDTVAFQLRTLELDPVVRERERILLPSAASSAGGAYKMLRTQVLRRLDQLRANTLMVLSPTSGAGKTLSAINLAIAIAAEPERTALLIDFDLRNPTVHKRLGFVPTLGVEDCIESGRPVQEAMVKIQGYDRLTILPARARVEHSSELLGGRRTAEVVAEMRERYANRVLIFDMAPVIQADDAIAFARNVQAGLVVVSEGQTKRDELLRTIELLRELPLVGTLLNNSRDASDTYY